MTQRLLFVCHANVCRSPVMMWTMTKALQGSDVRVASAGVQAARQGLLCDVAREVLGDAVPSAKKDRKAASITRSMIDAADLIITATKGERSTLALLSPGIRSRVFTLREAVLLGEGGDAESDWLGEGGLGAYAAALHRRRGLLTLPKPPRFRIARQTDPLDHADVHQARRRLHRSGLDAVQMDTLRLAAQLSGSAGASTHEH